MERMRARKGTGIGQHEDRIKKHKMSKIDQNLSKSHRTASQPPKVTPKRRLWDRWLFTCSRAATNKTSFGAWHRRWHQIDSYYVWSPFSDTCWNLESCWMSVPFERDALGRAHLCWNIFNRYTICLYITLRNHKKSTLNKHVCMWVQVTLQQWLSVAHACFAVYHVRLSCWHLEL